MGKCIRIFNSLSKVVQELLSDVGEEGSTVLYSLVSTKFAKVFNISVTTRDFTVSRVVSAYVPGITVPTAFDYNPAKTDIIMTPETSRHIQRIVSGRGFYNSPYLRQECVLIEAERDSRPSRKLWVGKVLALLRLPPIDNNSGKNLEGEDEFFFVQYFEVEKPQDEKDKKLSCIRLRWAHEKQDVGERDSSGCSKQTEKKWFDLIEISAIRGMVHVVRGD